MEILKYCNLDNPIFKSALFWIGLFVFTGCFTLYFKRQEKQEEIEKAKSASKVETPQKKAAKTQAKQTP
jgi:hypothetical protein